MLTAFHRNTGVCSSAATLGRKLNMTDLNNYRNDPQSDRLQEFLSAIPYQLGFLPQDAIVTVVGQAQGDYMKLKEVHSISTKTFYDLELAERCRVSYLGRIKPGLIVRGLLVVYSEPFFRSLRSRGVASSAEEEECANIAYELAQWLDHPSFSAHRTFVVGTSGWACLSCPAPGHCDKNGRSVASLKDTHVSVEMIMRGYFYAPSPGSVVPLPSGESPRPWSEMLAREMDAWEQGDKRQSAQWVSLMFLRWERLLTNLHQEADIKFRLGDLGVLGLSLHSVPLRDNVIYALCTGKRLPHPVVGDERHFDSMFSSRQPPDETFLKNAISVLADMAQATPKEYRSPILAVWAWSHWWLGHRVHANVLCIEALNYDPQYSLARTLSEVLANHGRPPWLRADKSNYS